MRTYYIIEHSSKGVFLEWHDWEPAPGGRLMRKPWFRWSLPRNKAKHFWSQAAAGEEIKMMTPADQAKCVVLEMTSKPPYVKEL